MPDNKESYPYSYIFKGQRIILVWQSGDGEDTFRLDSYGKLIGARDNDELKKLLGDDYIKVNWDEGAEIDFDRCWIALKNLRVGRASSPKTCRLMLDGWNFIEDLLRTFGLTRDMQKLKSSLLNNVYDKLFHGVNLPSVTPNNKSYAPLWRYDEILSLRNEMRIIWESLQPSLDFTGN